MPNDPKDYEVGFAKPLKKTQFQKGKSGIPKRSHKRTSIDLNPLLQRMKNG
jgi:hypothetical protein